MKKLILLVFFFAFNSKAQVIIEPFTVYHDSIKLSGILSYPESKKPLPLALFIAGSGPIDRDGNYKPMIHADYAKQLADSLNQRGIAFLRFDKRTFSKENIRLQPNIGFEDLVADVATILKAFEKDNRFKGYHLIGHSQGSLIAMLQKHKKLKSFISLSGPARPMGAILITQITQQSKELAAIAKTHIEELQQTDTIKEVNPLLLSLFAPQNQKFIKSWMAFDPQEEIKKVNLPTLILNGDLDIQVPIEEAKLLKAAQPKATLLLLENTTHTLKEVTRAHQQLATYTDPKYPLSNNLVLALEKFIKSNE